MISRTGRAMLAAVLALAASATLHAQVSLTSAVDLALRSNPKVRAAQAQVDKARAQLGEARFVYTPSLSANSGLGYSYGFPLGQPTIFSVTSQSLLFSYAQRDYIKAARVGVDAAGYALEDARLQIEEDTAITYLQLNQQQQILSALDEQLATAEKLVQIVQARVDAGQDTQLELLRAQRIAAQIRLQQIRTQDQREATADHLARVIGLPGNPVATVPESVPAAPATQSAPDVAWTSPVLLEAEANVRAKQRLAQAESHYMFVPQIIFAAEYSRFSNINNYKEFYPTFNNFNAAEVGIQISLPLFDRAHMAKSNEANADAVLAIQQAATARNEFQEGTLKLQHASRELTARADLARIERDIAQAELQATITQNENPMAGGTPLSPKDLQRARVQERQRYIDYLNADLELQQNQVRLLRMNGGLEQWLSHAAQPKATETKQ
ncbi:MAG: TolC family protein [Acidobacteriota bacterium]|nr:TolC family protein [Acidobacteriota bacterium]